MGLLTTVGGAKVGWNYWPTRAEAEADAVKQREEAARKAARGFDFGYLTPGSIDELVLPRDLRAYGAQDGEDDERYPVVARAGETVYKVVTP